MVFYYYSNCSISVGRYRDRVQWQGDISRWDGSIQLRGVQVNDSGKYLCEMRLLQHSSIFKNHTVLHVSPMARTGTCPALPPLTSHPSDPSQRLPELHQGSYVVVPNPCGYQPLPWCLPSRSGSSECPGLCGPGRQRALGCDCGLRLCGRGAGIPGRTHPEEEVPIPALGLWG